MNSQKEEEVSTGKQKNLNWYNYCRVRCPENDLHSNEFPEIAKQESIEKSMAEMLAYDYNCVRNMSDGEVDELILKTRSHQNLTISENMKRFEKNCKVKEMNETNSDPLSIRCHFVTKQFPLHTMEFREPKAQWVQIEETCCPKQTKIDMICQNTGETKSSKSDAVTEMQKMNEHEDCNAINDYYGLPYDYYDPHSMPTMLMNEVFSENLKMLYANDNKTYGEMLSNNNQEFIEQQTVYLVEDSDLEYEMNSRPKYVQYCNNRPDLNGSIPASVDEGGEPVFIEIKVSQFINN